MQDLGYRDFQCKLMPTVDPKTVIGVRMPMLRQLAKDIGEETHSFLSTLPHDYYEENNLHGIMISMLRDAEETYSALDKFLPYVDNWSTCDLIAPKVFTKHPDGLLEKVRQWIASGHTYTVRFGIGVLLRYYLDDGFLPEHLDIVSKIQSEEYYVNMMIAWYFATALAKQYDTAIVYIEQRKLSLWCHKKAIQKAIESYRITPEQKEYLRNLK